MIDSTSPRWTLRELPFAARLALAAFLISVGIGYCSALVQLHFQHASNGELMPGNKSVVRIFHGEKGTSVLERLILAHETEPFTSVGSMRSAFTTKSVSWEGAIDTMAGDIGELPEAEQEAKKREAEVKLRRERDGEALILASWVRSGLDRASYENNAYPIPPELKGQPITKKYLGKDMARGDFVQIKTLLNNRCARCHKEGRDPVAAEAPLDTYKGIKNYARSDLHQGMPLRKLAQSTHVHLLGFSMLYGLTGLLLALTSWPAIIRVPLAPLPLIAQVADISFWWLARLPEPYGPTIATFIPISGGIVAVSLLLQILLSLWDLFGKGGKAVLLLLVLAAGGGAFVLKEKVIDPYIATARTTGSTATD